MSFSRSKIAPLPAEVAQQIQAIDYVELYVANARQALHYYRTAFGFTPIAYAGLETGIRDHVSYVLQREECILVLTCPLTADGPIAEHVRIHGDSVKDIAFRVKDSRDVYSKAAQLGATPLVEPQVYEDQSGCFVKATIEVYGDITHSFIQREGYQGAFLPQFQAVSSLSVPWTGLHEIDHFAISLPVGELQHWVDFYVKVLGFHQIHEEGIVTENSAMLSKAVQDETGRIRFVLMEPVPRKRRSQIEEFLTFHGGAGVQHIALQSTDIIKTVQTLENLGIDFVSAPDSYYEMLPERVGEISEDIAALQQTHVLVDRDEWGYLLQIFSLPVHSRPTLFIEIIQRKEARGFGSGNIQALFKALEREQARRGNL